MSYKTIAPIIEGIAVYFFLIASGIPDFSAEWWVAGIALIIALSL